MPTMTVVADGCRRRGPEALLAALAALAFLGGLGSVDLWGKREQRAAAEAIDTVDHGHWLVAEIQGRPRLEKPPLPRWAVAALMLATGRRDEWIVRLPGVVSALGMVALVYGLGRRIGGRSVGLASGFMLTSLGFFVTELRQAGNDGPLAFFTTLAVYAAWRRLHGASARWSLAFYAALGLGVLCKGPIVVAVVAMAVVPSLACAGRLRDGLGRLADARGAALFLLIAASWPLPVMLSDPKAPDVWLLEMGQKLGVGGIPHPHNGRLPVVADWPWMTLPWVVIATLGLVSPLRRTAGVDRSAVWLPWWWAAGNLAMFGLWSVAKPNYFLPCLPGVALLCGIEWVRLARLARTAAFEGAMARGVLQLHWVLLFVAAMVAPVVAQRLAPASMAWVAVASLTTAVAVVVAAWAWRRGGDALALAPIVAAIAVVAAIGYGAIAPAENPRRGHRALAATLERLLPPEARTVMFYHELDEGLWFYDPRRDFRAIPGSRPDYNDTYEAVEQIRHHRFVRDPLKRLDAQRQVLLSWLRRSDRPSRYVLLRESEYDRFAPSLAGLAEPIHRERGLHRNAFVLLRALAPPAVAAVPDGPRR